MEKVKERGLYRRGRIWYINYFVNGVRKREAIGPSKQLAREVLAKRRVEVKEGLYFNIKRDKITRLSEIVNDFLEYSRNNKRSYIRDKEMAGHLQSFLGNCRLSEITPHLIERYKEYRVHQVGRKPATVNRELGCLKAIFNWAIKNKKATENPVREVKFYQEESPRIRYLSEEEIQRLLASCPKHFRAVVIAALTTGMRKSEILNLTWDDVDLEKGLIYLQHTKSGRSREIPLCGLLSETLKECRQWSDGKYVFCSHKGQRYSKNIRTMFLRILRRAQISDFRFHDLRHTAASYLAMAGVDILTIKEILGHQRIEMTLRYSHLSPNHKRLATEILGQKIFSLAGQDSVPAKEDTTATPTATVGGYDKVTQNQFYGNYLINQAELNLERSPSGLGRRFAKPLYR